MVNYDSIDEPTTNEKTIELPNNVKPDYGHAKNKLVYLNC